MNSFIPNITITQDMLDRMMEKVLQNRPQLRIIMEKYGNTPYFDYIKQKNRMNLNKDFRERKKEFVDVMTAETTRLLGTAIAEDVEKQIKKNDSFSTAEHTTALATTNILNSSLHLSLPMFGNTDPRLRNVIVLSCSGISFNNASSFSRGLQFHSVKEGEIIDSNLVFFGRSADSESVIYAPPYTSAAVTEMKKKLGQLTTDGTLSQSIADKIEEILNKVYLHPHAMTSTDYVDQLTITNNYLWKKLFPAYNISDIPNYVMLSQEKIVLSLLLGYHIDQDTIIHRFLFDKPYHELAEKYFDGIVGAFKKEDSTGTFLFWGYSKENRSRLQLFREGNMLVSKDHSFTVLLEPKAIREAILQNEIFPGLLLTFVVLSFYYGLLLGGWTSQTNYLTQMKKAYITMLKELGDHVEAQNIEDSITDDLVIHRPHLAFLDALGGRIGASGLDMYLYQNPENWQTILNATKEITLREFITTLLPILYKQFCPDEQKEEVLTQITSADIEKFTGFDKRLPVLGTLS